MSDPNFIQGLLFIDALILASRIELFDINYRVRWERSFDILVKNAKNTQRGGQKDPF